MDANELIDAIRHSLSNQGFSMPMSKGRDAIARLLYGQAHSPVIAAMRAGTLKPPQITDAGIADIKARYGEDKADLAVKVAQTYLAS